MAHKRGVRPRGNLRANQEQRGGRILKAFRDVGQDDTQLLGGALVELMQDGVIPEIKVSSEPRAFIFDPRLMDKGVNPALIAGFKFGQFIARYERCKGIEDSDYTVDLGEVKLIGRNKRTVVCNVESERLAQEVAEFYRLLGEQGVKGFTRDGKQKGHRKKIPTIALGTFNGPIANSDIGAVEEAIDTSIAIQFGVASKPQVRLGELQLVTYDHRT